MEEEDQGESPESEALTQVGGGSEDTNHQPQDGQAEGGGCDGEDLCLSDAETFPQEVASNSQLHDCPPLSPMLTEGDPSSPPSSQPRDTQSGPGPCWYCLMSLDSENPEQEESDPLSAPPSSGQKVSYQTDPRPHFGVAWSSHSTSHPLWGSEGPSGGPRSQDVLDRTHPCPHCHLGMPPETLRWHEAKCLLFEELRNAKK